VIHGYIQKVSAEMDYISFKIICYIIRNMAEVEMSGDHASHILSESKMINGVNVCNKCWNYERRLKEALEELASLRTANKILQKELFVHNKDRTRINSEVSANGEWTFITAKNRKSDQSVTKRTDHIVKTANRFTLLDEAHADKIGSIPVVVNGYVYAKRATKVNNKNTPYRINGENDEMKQKKRRKSS
jgi:hypothetical protein